MQRLNFTTKDFKSSNLFSSLFPEKTGLKFFVADNIFRENIREVRIFGLDEAKISGVDAVEPEVYVDKLTKGSKIEYEMPNKNCSKVIFENPKLASIKGVILQDAFHIQFENRTGKDLLFFDEAEVSASANQINSGCNKDIILEHGATLELLFDVNDQELKALGKELNELNFVENKIIKSARMVSDQVAIVDIINEEDGSISNKIVLASKKSFNGYIFIQ